MGVVRALHAGGRVNQPPCLRHPGDQPVHGNSDPFGMGTWPAFDEPEHPVPHGVRLTPSPTSATTPAYSDPNTCTRGRGQPQTARLIQG